MNVKDFVYYEHLTDDYVVKHKHPVFECVYFFEGAAAISFQNVVYQIKAPCAVTIPPEFVHDEKELTKTKMFIITYEDEPSPKDAITLTSLTKEQQESIQPLFERAYAQFREGRNEECTSSFRMLQTLLKNYRFLKKENVDEERLIEGAKDFLEENFASKIDLAAYSKSCGYSYSRLRHIFASRVGASPHRYQINVCLSHAKDLLSDTEEPIAKVASLCGFRSMSLFDIFFRREMKMTPHQFRTLTRERGYGAVLTVDTEDRA